MKLKNLTLAELKAMSYADIAFKILEEEKCTMNTATLFHKICDLLGYSDEEFTAKVGDFYITLTTDCRFIILSNAEWDIRDKHVVKIAVDEEDEEVTLDEEEETDEESTSDEEPDETKKEENDVEEPIDDTDLDVDDDVEDDLEDLTIVDGDEEENV